MNGSSDVINFIHLKQYTYIILSVDVTFELLDYCLGLGND